MCKGVKKDPGKPFTVCVWCGQGIFYDFLKMTFFVKRNYMCLYLYKYKQ